MLPLQDLNPVRRTPVLTWLLIAINVLVFLWEFSLPEARLQDVFTTYSVVPDNISDSPLATDNILDLFRSMFLHGGWAHLLGNMLYLYLFGDNVENRLGWIAFPILYLGSGIVAALAQVMVDPDSTIPLVGASGAIAGVLGAYLVFYPGVKVRGIIPIGRVSTMAEWPAWLVLIMWFGVQLLNGVAALGPETQQTGGVAFFAHIGGFIAGAVFALIVEAIMPQPEPEARRDMLYERARRYKV